MTTRKTTTLLGIGVAVSMLAASAAWAQDKSNWPQVQVGTLSGGNAIYDVFLADDGGACGTWTASTGAMHPAGPGLNVLFGGGSPGTSDTILRSYTSGVSYFTAGSPTGCVDFCATNGPPTVTPILNDATVVGYSFSWTFMDGANELVFVQDVVVEGPVDGTETVENTVVRETHTVTNNGPGTLDFGIRKHWDWQIGSDDGPWIGDCLTPDDACDRSMNLSADGSGADAPYPQSYTINEDPAGSACPGSVVPNDPDGCDGAPLYIVAGTVAPPSILTPPPDAPELLQFNSWPALNGSCWVPPLADNATCAGGDTSIIYVYGATEASAETLAMGESKAFTQYVVAGEEACPEILNPGACCLGGGECVIALAADCMALGGVPQGDGTTCDPVEACCFTSGMCVETSPTCCTLASGINQGPGSVCLGDSNNDGLDDLCVPPPPTGACCEDFSGVCTENVTQMDCEAAGLRYGGDGSTCATIDPPCLPPPPTGACCEDFSGVCTENVTQMDCKSAGLRYGGDGSTCATIDPPCQVPTGACCEDFSGVCTENVTQLQCESAGLRYGGDGSTCATIDPPCDAPPPPPTAVPAASNWGMALLAVLLLGGLVWLGTRRRTTS